MEKSFIIKVLLESYLFKGIKNQEAAHLMKCLRARKKTYVKGEAVIAIGDSLSSIGVVLEGEAHIIHEDYWGNKIIFSELREAEVFGEVFAVLNIPSEVSIVANTALTVLWLDINELISVCNHACGYHNQLIRNLLVSISQKNLMLTRKMNQIGKKTIREKLLAYLSSESLKARSNHFKISFDRQELADYLFVDRSALSNEISKLKKEGIIKNRKNEFEI